MRTFIVTVMLVLVACTGFAADYTNLVSLYHEFREFRQKDAPDGLPDYTEAAMNIEYEELKKFQKRLTDIDSSSWPVSEQITYHLARAEMNGLEFQHRVLKPWVLDPGFYNDRMPGVRRRMRLPIEGEDIKHFRARLEVLPKFFENAKSNLKDLSKVAGDLGTLAVLSLGDSRASYEALKTRVADKQPELVPDVEAALAAIDDYIKWIEDNKHKMTARAGVGKENYNWLLKNVYLFPYNWDDIRAIVEIEDNRVITFRRLEENRNRNVPPLKPVQSQQEYRDSIVEAVEHVIDFIRKEEILTLDGITVPDSYFRSRWEGKGYYLDQPWPKKHDYFFNFSHREAVMENTHELVGHEFDGQRTRRDKRPFRGSRLPYKISTGRGEGFAFALEELLMHAGYLDGRNPHGREIAYDQAAFRTVRALSDIYMHSRDWTLSEATKFCIENAPNGEQLEGSHHLWYELDTTLRGVGHHMIMVVGKVQFMKLFRDRAQQLGDKFVLKEFIDEFLAAGNIPMSLIRWEMMGYEDEIKKLLR